MIASSFTAGQTVQYKINSAPLNNAYSWSGSKTLAENLRDLIASINLQTVTTDVSASLWYSNNAPGTYYIRFAYGQPGNHNGLSAATYINGTVNITTPYWPKRAMGYGTMKGNDIVGQKRYELSNHLGNVLEVVSDRKFAKDDGVYNLTTGTKTSSTPDGLADYYLPNILAYTDYDPYGTAQEGRKGGISDYRFGFQGQEQDDEIKGEGNSINYEYRMHDPRLGRFFAVDPLAPKYPWYTPYQFSGNKVIAFIELEGLEESKTNKNVHYFNVQQEGNKNIIPEDPSHIHKDLVIKTSNAFLRNRDTGEETPIGEGTFGTQSAGLVNVYTYWKGDAINKQVVVSSNNSIDTRIRGEEKIVAPKKKPTSQSSSFPVQDASLVAASEAISRGQKMTKTIVDSRSGYTSGKLKPGSPKVYNKAGAKSLGVGLNVLGHAITVYSVIDTYNQYEQGNITTARRNYNYVNAGIGTFIPAVGVPIAVGDYLGQKYHPEIEYQVTKGESMQALVWLFESCGMQAVAPGCEHP